VLLILYPIERYNNPKILFTDTITLHVLEEILSRIPMLKRLRTRDDPP
jgi:hypothetical protein